MQTNKKPPIGAGKPLFARWIAPPRPHLVWFWSALFVILLASLAAFGEAQTAPGGPETPAASSPTSEWAPVRVEGRRLFDVSGTSTATATQRADRINRRLETLIARDEPVRPFDQRDLVPRGNETIITLGGEPILSVTDGDAEEALMTRQELALLWGGKLAVAVADSRQARKNPLRGAGIIIRNSVYDLLISAVRWLPRLGGAIVLWLLFWVIARSVRWGVKAITDRLHLEPNLRQLLRAIAFYGVWTVGIVAMLSTLGLESGSIATALGISGFVLGFAFKDILSHFFAGMMLLMGRQFRIGDQIVVKEFEGTVERIELRALHLRTYDNRLVIIPNGDVFTTAVTSNTANPYRRREFVVGIGYDDDIQGAMRVALDAMRSTEGIVEDPPPDVLVDALGSSTVDLRLRFYMSSTRADFLRVGSECMRRVKEAFEREGISMPSDIQTIVVKNASELARVPVSRQSEEPVKSVEDGAWLPSGHSGSSADRAHASRSKMPGGKAA